MNLDLVSDCDEEIATVGVLAAGGLVETGVMIVRDGPDTLDTDDSEIPA